ncbi:MAG: ATP synthase F1 subunit epsilon [Halothiobacillaceae bacterium]
MAITVRVDIVSADNAVMGGEATFVVAPTTMGELGITPRHTQLLAQLKAGEVRVTDDKGVVKHFFVSGGVIEVQPNGITILADSALREEDAHALELIEEEARLKALESRLEIGSRETDYFRLRGAVEAEERLKWIESIRGSASHSSH